MPPTSEPDPTKVERRAAAKRAREEREVRIYDRYVESSERQERSNARLAAIGWSIATTAFLVCWAMVGDFGFDWPFLPWTAICFVAMVSSLYTWRRLSRLNSDDPAALAAQREERRRLRDATAAHDRRLVARRPFSTYVLVGVIGIVSGVEAATFPDSVERAALVKEATRAGEWWRIVTASFLHGSLPHIYYNLLSLLAIGRLLEAYLPRRHWPLVYLLAVIGGGLASVAFLPKATSLGASGGIMGLLVLTLVFAIRRPSAAPPWLKRGAWSALAINAVVGLAGFSFIDNAAHAGGAVVGALAGWFVVDRDDARHSTVMLKILGIAGTTAYLLLLGGALLAILVMTI